MAYRIFTVVLLLMAVAILQWHAIAFWQTHTGSLGWMWALGIEGAAIWLWWQPQRLVRVIGLVASVLSLAGPLHHVGTPVIEVIKQAQLMSAARIDRIDVLRGTLAAEMASLRQYQALADKRLGWSGRIDRTQERIDKVNDELTRLMAEKPSGGLSWGLAVVAMEALALMLLQVVVVLSIRSLATRKSKEVAEEPFDEEPFAIEQPAMTEASQEPPSESTDDLPIPSRLKRHFEASGESMPVWSRRHGLNADRVRQVLAGRASEEVMQAVGEALSR